MLERHYGLPAYDYWYGYSKAQIELMLADQPLIKYKKDKERKVTRKEAEKATEEWEKKYKFGIKKGETVSLNDIFNSKE